MTPDEYRLEDIANVHRIDAAMFVPFAILRLGGAAQVTEATLTVSLRGILAKGEIERKLRIHWSPASARPLPPGVQDNTITELAALGLACSVLAAYKGISIRQVAGIRDRFDYWVGEGDRQFGLEVSGTLVGDVESRHRAKVRQLRGNPHKVDGYVIVVGFTTQSIVFSFNQFEEKLP